MIEIGKRQPGHTARIGLAAKAAAAVARSIPSACMPFTSSNAPGKHRIATAYTTGVLIFTGFRNPPITPAHCPDTNLRRSSCGRVRLTRFRRPA